MFGQLVRSHTQQILSYFYDVYIYQNCQKLKLDQHLRLFFVQEQGVFEIEVFEKKFSDRSIVLLQN